MAGADGHFDDGGVIFGRLVINQTERPDCSGVVAAATTMVFCAPPLIYMVLGELEARENEREA